MIKISFLKKDETAKKIYLELWKNRNVRAMPKNPHFFNRFAIVKPDTQMFILDGFLYVISEKYPLVNCFDRVYFFDDEIYSTIAMEKVDFQRQKGQGKFLTEENLEKRFELKQFKASDQRAAELNPTLRNNASAFVQFAIELALNEQLLTTWPPPTKK